MSCRWFCTLALLGAVVARAAAQAPIPAGATAPASAAPPVPLLVNGSPAAPAAPTVPLLVNGSPAPAAPVDKPKATRDAEIKPAVAAADAAATPGPLPPSVQPAALAHDGPPESGVSFDGFVPADRRVWGRAEYLLWRVKDSPVPAILGTIPDRLATLNELPPGAITTTFGGSLNYGLESGARFELGVALDAAGCWGISGSYFQLEHASTGARFVSNGFGSPVVGPVFFDPVIDRQTIILFADPGVNRGDVEAIAESRLWGFEVNGERRLPSIFGDRLDFIVGYRHINFDESLATAGTATFLPGQSSLAYVTFGDQIGVRNEFDGAQIGLSAQYGCGKYFLDVCGKIGIGNEHETDTVGGTTTFVSADPTVPTQRFNGGVLAQPTNSGHFDRNRFSFMGEVSVNAGVRLFDNHVKAFVGYDFLGLSKVLRVDNVIDGVDAKGVPSLQGSMRDLSTGIPGQKVDDGRFWAQGLTLGLALEY